MGELTIWLAFGAGVLSFISPCCFPLYPSYISYITGMSVSQLSDRAGQSKEMQRGTLLHTFFFILGFSIVFLSLGSLATWIGDIFNGYQSLIRMLGGVLIVAMGLFLLGVFQPSFMMREKKFEVKNKPVGYLGSSLVGIAFAAGWTPCVGPILGAVLTMASSDPSRGMLYTVAYTLGFAIPFFIMAFFVGRTRWILKYSGTVMKIGGGIMVVFGVLLYFDQMTVITSWLSNLFGGFRGF
ncbi:cytochrome c biogenesis CcdA family protein [Mechercharimyces sp. CAU 1602]|uniref:cytochrome c biogenesis CcdA family protein n=1 Tax=Mechercharimyces sp. CAU 1602 TaxID=2973933 RepID=UPI002162AC03|nr:cytochrome c biogenesis protein CcdA [Mechercharimyces sp. CAU 1602]MCS1350598.1 cytochrome c biogenesis protein CcdA [Mechercharimyces sp. CAU 1602]